MPASKLSDGQAEPGSVMAVKRSSSFAAPSPASSLAYRPSPRSQSISAQGGLKRSQTITATTPRRLNRKLPPELTESLLALEELHQDSRSSLASVSSGETARPSDSPGYSTMSASDSDTLASSLQHSFATYTLSVDPPLPQKDQIISHDYHHHTHRRSSSLTPSDVPSVSFSVPSTPSSQFSHSQFRHNWPSRRNLPSAPPEDVPENPPSLATCSTASTSCWSAFDDLEASRNLHERVKPGQKESRREKKERKKHEAEVFSPDQPPDLRDLFEASMCEVIDERGTRLQFRDVLSGRQTIVVFIRHWYCPLCAQYMNSIIANVTPRALEEAEVDLIVIGNGSHKMLDGYRNKSFKFPFRMYTDPTLELYRALGLTRQTGDAGADADAGTYLVQTPLESTVQTIKRATKMPLRSPGHFLQLGGEFVFEGSLKVNYTHRMTTTRDHSPIEEVCEAAGLRLEYIHYEPGPRPPPVHRDSLDESEEDGAWRAEREETLAEMRMKKERRRRGWGGNGGQNGLEVAVVEEDEERELVERIRRLSRGGFL